MIVLQSNITEKGINAALQIVLSGRATEMSNTDVNNEWQDLLEQLLYMKSRTPYFSIQKT